MDTPEDRAQRVETVLETGDINKAMTSLKDEMGQVTSPDDRAAVLQSLKSQNERARQCDWTLPSVSVEQSTEWGGLVTKPNEYTVNMSQNILQKIVSYHPLVSSAGKISRTLAAANDQK